MIKIGMCDDDLNSIKTTAKLLEAEIIEQDLDAEITAVSDNQKEIFDQIFLRNIDILFLDIDFKKSGKNGIEFAKDLRKINKDFYLVFLSAHQRYIHVSLITKVFDFLVKPINRETLSELVIRLKDEFTTNNSLFLHLNRWNFVRTDDILYIEKSGKKSLVVTREFSYPTTKNLNTLLEELPRNFARCHKSYILNKNKVISIDKKSGLAIFGKNISCPVNSQFVM